VGSSVGAAGRFAWTKSIATDPGEAVFYDLRLYVDSSAVDPSATLLGLPDTTALVSPTICDSFIAWLSAEALNGHEVRQNTSPDRVRLLLDRTPPTGDVIFPAAGSLVPGLAPPPLRFAVQDWGGPTQAVVTLSVDGGDSYADTIYAGTYVDSLPWTPPGVQSDHCRLKLVVQDAAENEATIESDSLFTIYGDLTDVGAGGIPTALALRAQPVPARTATEILFDLPMTTPIRIEVFDVAGRSVRMLAAGQYAPGSYSLPWDLRGTNGARLPAGVFFIRLQAGDKSRLSRVVILR